MNSLTGNLLNGKPCPKRPYKSPVPVRLAAARGSHFPGSLFRNKFHEIVLGEDLLSLEWSRISAGKPFAEWNRKATEFLLGNSLREAEQSSTVAALSWRVAVCPHPAGRPSPTRTQTQV